MTESNPPPTPREAWDNLMVPLRRIRDRICIAILKTLIRLVRTLTALVKWLKRCSHDR